VKAPSPLLGFNNNVRHRGRVFHIQTEDSGIRHPHIITHLFADGGRILKTTKTSYVEHLGQERLSETVRAMMQDQHKAMFIALRDGQFDYLFDDSGPATVKASKSALEAGALPPAPLAEAPRDGGAPLAEGSAAMAVAAPPVTMAEPLSPMVVPVGEPPPEPVSSHPTLPDSANPPARPAPVVAAHPAPVVVMPRAPVVVVPPPPGAGKLPYKPLVPRPVSPLAPTEPQRAAVVPVVPHAPALAGDQAVAELSLAQGLYDGAPGLDPRPKARTPPEAPRRRGASRPTLEVDPGAIHGVTSSGEPSIDLDLDALERAAAEAQTPFFQQIQDLPPPPAAVLGSKRASTGGYSVRSPMPAPAGQEGGPRLQAPGPVDPRRAPSPPAPPSLGAPSPGRYAPSRPASIFATTRPQEGASIFGEDLISEKSLDEVILSYLAEDLDGPAEKK
jgi:hypothetical protein